MSKTVSEWYLEGIRDGRKTFESEGMSLAKEHLENLKETAKRFSASSEVGQLLRGERDFWANKLKSEGAAA